MQNKKWARLLAYVTGLVNQQLLLQNEYLAAENRILRSHLPARLRLSDPERSTLAEMGKRLGRRGLEQVAGVARPDTILAWYRRLIARKFHGSQPRPSGIGPDGGERAQAVWHRTGTEAVPEDHLEGIHFRPPGCVGGDRLFHGRSAYLARSGYLLRSVLPPTGDPTRKLGGYHPASRRRVDDANGAQRDGPGLRVSAPTSVRAPRPRHEVRRGIPGDTGRRRSEVPATPSAEPELECLCGTLCAIRQGGVSIEADPVRGSFVEESANRIPRALPRRKKSSGQGQQAAVSSTHSTGISTSWEGSMPGAIRWAAQVL